MFPPGWQAVNAHKMMCISCRGSSLQLGVIARAAASSGPEIQTVANEGSQPAVQQTTDISGLWVRKGSPRGGQGRKLLGQGHPKLPWVGWGWLSHSAPKLGHGQGHPPPLGAQLGLPMELLLFCRAAGLHDQPGKLLWPRSCTSAPAAVSLGVHSLGLSRSCSFVLGPAKAGAGLCFRQLRGGEVGVGCSPPVWGGLPCQDTALEGAGSGRVPAALAKLGTAKAFLSGGGLELEPASFSLPKHLLSCTLPFPLPRSSSGHGNV